MSSTEYYNLKDFDTITLEVEFEVEPGKWARISADESVSALWMLGMKYSKRIFVPARRKIK